MKFNPKVVEDGIFAADMVMKEWGGKCDFVYQHDKYWPMLDKMCENNRMGWMEKWRTLGGKVGVKEWDYKGEASGDNLKEQEVDHNSSEKVAEPMVEALRIQGKLVDGAITVNT